MPENDQIQHWFRPEIQANPQIQQNDLVQSQQQIPGATQQLIQQNNPVQNQQPIQGITQQIIQQNTQQDTGKAIQTIYYHPLWLTKILSGIYRFLWIFLVRAWLWNFSLIWTKNLSFLNILYVWWTITLCGILYIVLWRLLYSTKKEIHFWFSLLWALTINAVFYRIFMNYYIRTDGHDILISLLALIYFYNFFSIIYFSILTIIWIIKCRKFNKEWIINTKYLSPKPSKKKVWIVTTIILFLPIMIWLIYWKIQRYKIPKVEESTFHRTEHQVKLPDEEDGLIQLRNYIENLPDIFQKLDWIKIKASNDEEIWWKSHQDECIPIYSWWNSYCGTRVYNKKTIYRLLNIYLNEDNYSMETKGYPTNEENKITLMKYLDKNDSNIRNTFLELDNILSMDYYIPNDEYLWGFPVWVQGFARASTILLQYYIHKKDWDMVILIVKVNYKIIDISNHVWGIINVLISTNIQWVISNEINSSINLLPKDVILKIIELLPKSTQHQENMVKEAAKWEYVAWNQAKKIGLLSDYWWVNEPSLTQFLFHFPFYSYKNTERAMLYVYDAIYHEKYDNLYKFEEKILNNWFIIYNYYGKKVCWNIFPRYDYLDLRLSYHSQKANALINNLEAWNHKIQFIEVNLNSYPYNSSPYTNLEEFRLTTYNK